MNSKAVVNQIAKEKLQNVKYSNKFLGALNDVANEFLEHLADASNKVTLNKNKSKMVPDDIFAALVKLEFPADKIDEFRVKMKDFEEEEKVTLAEEKGQKSQVDR